MAHSPFIDRLEALRVRLGLASIQDFVDALNARSTDEPVPYATARRYHRDREPPAPYLVRVAQAFDARLEWLLAGEGPMLKSDVATEEAASTAPWLERLPLMIHCPPVVRAALAHHCARWDAERWRSRAASLAEDQASYAVSVWRDILTPLDGAPPLDWPAFTNYALAAIHARDLALLVPTAQED